MTCCLMSKRVSSLHYPPFEWLKNFSMQLISLICCHRLPLVLRPSGATTSTRWFLKSAS
ncbi:hypothetical protein DUNSADRAFT_14124 [Dunaliella salina]|uniref:Uncharacterized protein n=1 Tax=Dunaliella salina TaxID=3046 RepID=A0ABQ7G7Y1_DUNSA|nr:hypothetical protein DUNSADRAFT_14124 [Dunaliella salina]|eukprot:KAF5830718.1 hypothetical protein DUNSADRAFT_14124 [Dunaliella salina]